MDRFVRTLMCLHWLSLRNCFAPIEDLPRFERMALQSNLHRRDCKYREKKKTYIKINNCVESLPKRKVLGNVNGGARPKLLKLLDRQATI